MEMKYVVPDMAQSFGTLEFAGESEPVFERDKNNRRVLARRSYNLYSDIQKGENVVVEIPVQAGEKHFKYEQKVKLVNPKLYGRGYAIGDMGHTDYVLLADDIVAVVIEDNGCGIKASDLSRVFEKGFTGSNRNKANATGMGLYLSKKLCDRLGLKLDILIVRIWQIEE